MRNSRRNLAFLVCLVGASLLPVPTGSADPTTSDLNWWNNNIPPRLQWEANFGYCGEVSLISAGLYYGQYLSQYDARAIASHNTPQSRYRSQLLLGINDHYAASQMHLNSIEWNYAAEKDTDSFLKWVKENVLKGYPVAIGIYMNMYRFYHDKNPRAGSDYDHIVPVFGIGSTHPLTDGRYYTDDIVTFSDNGLWHPHDPPYFFSYEFGGFQASRKQANARNGAIYSTADNGTNFGIAITGVKDTDHETVPVRVDTNVNYEIPAIKNGSNERPAPMPLVLTVTVSGLTPGVTYRLYRYNSFESVPDNHFNAHAGQAYQSWTVQIASGDSWVMTQDIASDEIGAYRAVPAAAP